MTSAARSSAIAKATAEPPRRHEPAAATQPAAWLGRLYGEGLRFMQQRWETNGRALLEIAAGRSFPDTLSAWSRYFDLTARQYSDEFESLAEICGARCEPIDEVPYEIATIVASPEPAEA